MYASVLHSYMRACVRYVYVSVLHACMRACLACVHVYVRGEATRQSTDFFIWSLDFPAVGYEIKGLQFIIKLHPPEPPVNTGRTAGPRRPRPACVASPTAGLRRPARPETTPHRRSTAAPAIPLAPPRAELFLRRSPPHHPMNAPPPPVTANQRSHDFEYPPTTSLLPFLSFIYALTGGPYGNVGC